MKLPKDVDRTRLEVRRALGAGDPSQHLICACASFTVSASALLSVPMGDSAGPSVGLRGRTRLVSTRECDAVLQQSGPAAVARGRSGLSEGVSLFLH